jgi:peptidoglycan hydrolase CwlO-like protein
VIARIVRLAAGVAILGATGGCASVASTPPPASSLSQADSRLAAADYRGAIGLYDEFLRTSPNDPAAGRARATRLAVEQMIQAQAEVDRLQTEVARLKAEADRRRPEVDRLRAEVDRLRAENERLKAETTRLRADLERLRTIDLRQLPPTR